MKKWNASKAKTTIRRVSKKRAAELKEYKLKRNVFLTLNKRCQCCNFENATDVHHSRGKIGRLLNETKYWFALCRNCHRQVTDNPIWARAKGLLCEKGKWNSLE